MKKNCNKKFVLFLILTIISIFFSACVFLIVGRPFFYFYIFLLPLFVYVLTFNNKSFFHELIKLYKYTPFKYYFWFILWLLLSAIIVVILKMAKITIFYYIFVKLFPVFILCYLLSAYFIPKYISVKFVIKLFISIMWGILPLSLIGFIGDLYDIKIFSGIVNGISNIKSLSEGVEMMTEDVTGLPRARGVFPEPGGLGKFITIFLPLIYNVGLSKCKIYKNSIINLVIKKSFIPLAWISLICTFSPISLIFGIIISAVYFAKKILIYIRKYFVLFVLILTIFSSLLILVFVFDITNVINLIHKSFLSRIISVSEAFKNYQSFVVLEGSLASRISSWTNSFILFLKSPIYGYGYDNVRFFMYKQFLNSPVPLTKENINNIVMSLYNNNGVWYNRSLLFGLLAETGIVGTFLYFKFLFKNIEFAKSILRYFVGIENLFLRGMIASVWIVILTSFYSGSFSNTYLCFLYGLFCSYSIAVQNRFFIVNKEDINEFK